MMYTNNMQVAGKSKFEIAKLIRRGHCTIDLLAEELRDETNRMLGNQNNGFLESLNPPRCDWGFLGGTIRIEKYPAGQIRIHGFHPGGYTDFIIQLDFQTCGDNILPITGEVHHRLDTDNDTIEMYFNTIVCTLAEFWTEKTE